MKEQYAYTKKKHCAQNNDARDNKARCQRTYRKLISKHICAAYCYWANFPLLLEHTESAEMQVSDANY